MKEERKEKKKNYKRPKSLYTENREEWDARREAGVTIIIDCDWTPMMTDKEYSSFLHQLGYVYAANKKSENPWKLMFTGVSEKLKTELVTRGASYWPIGIHSESYIDRLPKE